MQQHQQIYVYWNMIPNPAMRKLLLLLVCTLCFQLTRAQKLVWFMENGKFGYTNKQTGKVALTPQFIFAGPFSEDLAVAAVGNHMLTAKYGFINEKGKWVIPPSFGAADQFSEGKARVQQQGKWGYIRKDGQWAIQPQFYLCYEFQEGMAPAAAKAGQWGIIDSTGKFLVTPVYYDITQPFAHIACVQKTMGGPWEILDIRTKKTIPTPYTRMYAFSDSLAPARDTADKWGFVDIQGNWVIAPTFTNAHTFSEGLAAVEQDYGQWGFINNKGEWIIEPSFQRHGIFKNGVALVEKDTEMVYIDKEGNVLFRFKR